MNFFHWLTDGFSDRGKAMALYKRGMAKAKQHDRQGAIDDYSAVAAMRVPVEVRAMAIYNRALVHIAVKDDPKAIDDLNMVLGMKGMKETLSNIKTEARRRLVRIDRRSNTSSA
jgi:hypothetical protein